MRIISVDQDSQSWIEERRGRVMGSKLKDLYSTRGERKDAFYQLIADNLILLADDESDGSDRDRGHEKELEAIEFFIELTGKDVDTKPGMWIADFNDRIGISPDGAIKKALYNGHEVVQPKYINRVQEFYTEALEVKSLAAKNHIKAICMSMDGKSDKQILHDYWPQVIQYFVVCETLQVLHFIFFDDRITAMPFFMIDVQRKDVQEDVDKFRAFEEQLLLDVESYVQKLAFGL